MKLNICYASKNRIVEVDYPFIAVEDLRELLKENIKLYQFKMVKLRDKPHMNENQKVSQRIYWNGKIDKNKELLAELGKEEK